MASQPPTPPGAGARGAAAEEEAFVLAQTQGFLPQPEGGDGREGGGDVYPDEDPRGFGGEGDGGDDLDGEPLGAAYDYANHPAVVGFQDAAEGDPGAGAGRRDDQPILGNPAAGRREAPPPPKRAAVRPPGAPVGLNIPAGIPLYDAAGRLLGYQPAAPIQPPPTASVPRGIPLYDASGQLAGFQPGQLPTTSRVTPSLSTAASSATRPQGTTSGLSGVPSFVQVPVMSGAFMPPPQVLQQIESAGGAFGMILAYLAIPTDICLALLTGLDMNINESFVVILGLRDDELDRVISELRVAGKPISVGMRSRIRMAIRIARVMGGGENTNVTQLSTPPQQSTPTGSSSSTTPVEKNDPNMVALNETVSQTNDGKVKKLPRSVIKDYRKNYVAFHRVEPPTEEDIADELLTALHTVFFILELCYVDFCLFTPFWARLARKRRFIGLVPNE